MCVGQIAIEESGRSRGDLSIPSSSTVPERQGIATILLNRIAASATVAGRSRNGIGVIVTTEERLGVAWILDSDFRCTR